MVGIIYLFPSACLRELPFYHALVSIRIFKALFHVFPTSVRMTLLTLGILVMFDGKKGRNMFHNLFSHLYWMATFSEPQTVKINIFTRHLANTKKKHNISTWIKQNKNSLKNKNSLQNTEKSPQNLSLMFRLLSFLLAVSLSICHKTLHFSSHTSSGNLQGLL